jgi:hypothetical protein
MAVVGTAATAENAHPRKRIPERNVAPPKIIRISRIECF